MDGKRLVPPAGTAAERAGVLSRLQLGTLDVVVACSLAVIPLSYYLGLSLDWGSETMVSGNSEELEEEGAAEPKEENSSEPASGSAAGPLSGAAGMDQASWDEMVRRLQVEAISYPGRVAIYMKDLKRGKTWAHQADDLFPSASLIKVPIMVGVMQRVREGTISLHTKVALRRKHRIGGAGSLKWYRDGTQLTVHQLLAKMIDESDNTAMRMLIDTAGFGYLQSQFPKMGLVYTEIFPEGLSLQSGRVSYENYTTAREMGMLLETLYRGQMLDREASEYMLDLLKHQKSRARLARSLPKGWEIAHKTGTLRGACHDSAVIFSPGGDFILTILTGQNREYARAKDFITKLGRIAYRHYQGDAQFLARATPAAVRGHGRRDRPGIID